MRIVEGGLMKKWEKQYWPVSKCRGQGTFAEASALTLQKTGTIYLLLLVGIVLALCVLVLEKLIWNANLQSKVQKVKM